MVGSSLKISRKCKNIKFLINCGKIVLKLPDDFQKKNEISKYLKKNWKKIIMKILWWKSRKKIIRKMVISTKSEKMA